MLPADLSPTTIDRRILKHHAAGRPPEEIAALLMLP